MPGPRRPSFWGRPHISCSFPLKINFYYGFPCIGVLLREVRTPTRLIYHINKRVTMYRYFDFGEKMATFSRRYHFVDKWVWQRWKWHEDTHWKTNSKGNIDYDKVLSTLWKSLSSCHLTSFFFLPFSYVKIGNCTTETFKTC